MQVREGWSTSYGEQRFDVTVEESAGDLAALLAENGIDPDLVCQLKLAEKFLIMEAECQRLSAFAKLERGHDTPAGRAEVENAKERLKAALARAKARLESIGG